ncbi:hypothetical protein BpHYR1_047519 [Brachionus plicatilis]|uniref:Uncharacterized protein n=1 Tax=Brachionus plicatilis TaxID=10195 RepID=A0A3M7RK57_BRAPC|nr:hypothetical protein BpHYR1_047519 [Brachionus plicatilis]
MNIMMAIIIFIIKIYDRLIQQELVMILLKAFFRLFENIIQSVCQFAKEVNNTNQVKFEIKKNLKLNFILIFVFILRKSRNRISGLSFFLTCNN